MGERPQGKRAFATEAKIIRLIHDVYDARYDDHLSNGPKVVVSSSLRKWWLHA